MYLFLIRHGESEGNVTGRLQGWQDAPLTRRGEHQAVRMAMTLRQFIDRAGVTIDAIYSSPLQRAARTADAVSQVLGLPVQPEPGLREMYFGRVEGLTDAEWRDCFPEIVPAWQQMDNLDFGWPDGETRRAFYERVATTLGTVLAGHPSHANVVVVAHGAVIGSYLSYLATGDWHHWLQYLPGNCSISHITLEPDQAGPPPMACLLALPDSPAATDPDLRAVEGEV
jgi:broad specificity phosphatase PhoE